MRVLYVIVGLLLGVILSARHSKLVVDSLVESQTGEVFMGQLMGFHQGYSKGYVRGHGKGMYLFRMCYDELEQARVYIKERENQ